MERAVRMCIDYRLLNRQNIIKNVLDSMTGSKWFSVLDLRSGYFYEGDKIFAVAGITSLIPTYFAKPPSKKKKSSKELYFFRVISLT